MVIITRYCDVNYIAVQHSETSTGARIIWPSPLTSRPNIVHFPAENPGPARPVSQNLH